MRIIAITGKVDKRPLVYTAARALGVNRFVGIITDNGAYRRLYEGEGLVGTCGRINILTTLTPDDNTAEKMKLFGVEHDVLMFVTDDFIPSKADFVVKCESHDTSMLAAKDIWEDTLEKLKAGEGTGAEREPDEHIVISPEAAPKGCETFWLTVNMDMVDYCMKCEENRGLMQYSAKDKKALTEVCRIMAPACGISQEEMETLMLREDYIGQPG